MDAQLATRPLGARWVYFCGVILVGAAAKEAVSRLTASPIPIAAPRRPTVIGILIGAAAIRAAVSRLGRLGVPTAP